MGILSFLKSEKVDKGYGMEVFNTYDDTTTFFSDEIIAKEGYKKNTIVYKCVNLISDEASKITYKLKNADGDVIDDHPVLDKLNAPNKAQGASEFKREAFSNYLLFGNSFILAMTDESDARTDREPVFLYNLSPINIEVKSGPNFMPSEYVYTKNSIRKVYQVSLTGQSNIMHTKTYNPTNPFLGLAPIQAAEYQAEQFNESSRWNKNLLKNSGSPSGILSVKDRIGPDQVQALESKFKQKMTGSNSAGATMVIGGAEFEWIPYGLSPKDMDFINGVKISAQMVASVYNVPMELLNLETAKYDNIRAASEQLFDSAVAPLVDNFADEFTRFLLPRYAGLEGYRLEPDYSQVLSIEEKKARKIEALDSVSFMTINEKRAEVGLEPLEGGDSLLVDSNKMPVSDLDTSDIEKGLTTMSESVTAVYG